MELAEGQPHRFGGLGLMVAQPPVIVRLSSIELCKSDDQESAQRIDAILSRLVFNEASQRNPTLSAKLVSPARFHCGLGLGTQLACAVAAGARLFSDESQIKTCEANLWTPIARALQQSGPGTIEWLTRSSSRGKRSAIGLQGFLTGGLILDHGHVSTDAGLRTDTCDLAVRQPETIATEQIDWPPHWPVVLIIPHDAQRVCGQREQEWMRAAATKENATRDVMWQLARRCIECAGAANFLGFITALEQYAQLAGEIFREVQGGLFRGSAIAGAVELAQQAGLRAVGQSSWGPTVFGFAENDSVAKSCSQFIKQHLPDPRWEVIVTGPSHGAQWRVTGEE